MIKISNQCFIVGSTLQLFSPMVIDHYRRCFPALVSERVLYEKVFYLQVDFHANHTYLVDKKRSGQRWTIVLLAAQSSVNSDNRRDRVIILFLILGIQQVGFGLTMAARAWGRGLVDCGLERAERVEIGLVRKGRAEGERPVPLVSLAEFFLPPSPGAWVFGG